MKRLIITLLLIASTAFGVPNKVTNSQLADMATARFKCRTSGTTGSPEDCTATQATAILSAVVGDSGAGGTKGLVPAPAAGDAAAAKFLKADGTWAAAGVSAHSGLSGLTTGDDHTQYALLAGRAGGQTVKGGTASGDDLTLQSTNHATKGTITAGIIEVDEVNNRVGIGMAGVAPSYRAHFRAGADDYAHAFAFDHVSGGANSLWRIYPDLNGTFSIYNPAQATTVFSISATQQQLRLGEGGADGGAVNIRNHTGQTAHHTLVLKKLGSQTGDAFRYYDTDGSTVLAKIDVAGAGTLAGLTVSTLTAGAMITDASGVVSRVAPSTSGNVLTSNGTTWTSSAPAGGGGSTIPVLTVKTANYTLANTDGDILCNSATPITITLYAANDSSRKAHNIKNINTGSCTIAGAGSDTIDGGTSAVLYNQYEAVEIKPDGSAAWYVF